MTIFRGQKDIPSLLMTIAMSGLLILPLAWIFRHSEDLQEQTYASVFILFCTAVLINALYSVARITFRRA